MHAQEQTNTCTTKQRAIVRRHLVHENFIIILSARYMRTNFTVEHKVWFLKQILVFYVGLDRYVRSAAIGQAVVPDILSPLLRCACG